MEFDNEKYKALKLPHPLFLHWILNPALAFNELALGQRIPKLLLTDIKSTAPLMERQYVPCPHCNALNESRLWAKGNAFGHRFGYLCPECDGKIPCLWNITSLALLAITFPLWIWLKLFGEKKWLAIEKQRLAKAATQLPSAKETKWRRMGALYGAIMFCVMALPKYVTHEISVNELAVHGVIWLISGIAFGLVMKFYMGRKV